MGISGLEWQTVQLPLASGLATKGDPRAQNPPALEVARDIEFDDIGGIRTRKPSKQVGLNIFGGGTLSNFRRTFENGDELLCFTKDTLYSWSVKASAWVAKGTHLAVSTSETTQIATRDDQSQCDRAELGNVIIFTWCVISPNATIFAAAIDKVSGAILVNPTSLGIGASNPRLVALQTRILLSWGSQSSGQIDVIAIDPANLVATIIPPVTAIAAAPTTAYDVVQIPGIDTAVFACQLSPNTSYLVAKVTSALVVTTSTKARTCDGPIAISVDPTATNIQIARGNGINVQGDKLLVSSLADVTVNQAIGSGDVASPLNHIAAAHRSVQNSGQYRCYVFWTSQVSTSNIDWQCRVNWVDTGGTIGTSGTFVRKLELVSRAFDYNGSVFVFGVFAQASAAPAPPFGGVQLQNTEFLYRDDGQLIARSVVNRSSGFAPGSLPGVQLTGGSTIFSRCATVRRVVQASGTGTAYAERAPCDVTFTFDSNLARRTVRIGQTLYISGALISQYDGAQIVEVGFLPFPYQIVAGVSATTGGLVLAGTYGYRITWMWINARGEVDRSTTTAAATAVSTTATTILTVTGVTALYNTLKPNPNLEVWRSAVNPQTESPLYLVSSLDPSATTNPNRFLANNKALNTMNAFTDALGDSQVTTQQLYPEDGGVMMSKAPPPGTILWATDLRVFLAGVAGDPDSVWYSKQRNDGEVIAFNEALTIAVPPQGDDIAALAVYRETLIVFRTTATYAFPGDGFDNTLGGQNYGPPRQLARDVGAVSQEAICVGPFGVLFKSAKGWYLLDDQWTCKYVGAAAAIFDGDTVASMELIESQHQVRIVTNARVLMFDYLVREWSEWTISDGLDATLWQGDYVYLSSNTGPMIEDTFATTTNYGLDIELAWWKLADLQGAGRARWMEILGEWQGEHGLRVRTAYDYESDGNGGWIYRDDVLLVPRLPFGASFPIEQSIVGSIEQFRRGFSRQQFEAVKIRLTAVGDFDFAEFATATDFTVGGAIATNGSAWTAIFLSLVLGAEGNGVQFAVYTGSGTGVEVRDHQKFTGVTWIAAPYVVGIRVGTDTQKIGTLESAIARSSRLVSLAVADVTPSKTISSTSTLHTGAFSGGDVIPCPGDALKLSGIALEVGIKRGLHRRLAAGQKG